MARKFKLPDLGEGIHEAEIQDILVAVGDEVAEDQDILVVETDKAAVDIPSPYAGAGEEILVERGDWVEVGDVLITFSGGDEEEPEPEKPEEEKAKAEQKKEEVEEEAEAPDREAGRPAPASPSTRRLARELEIDLRDVPGSGPGGRVTAEDVRAYAEAPPEEKKKEEAAEAKQEARPIAVGAAAEAPELPDFTQWGEVERVPVRSVRREIAKQMARSWAQVPHVNHEDEVDITELEQLRQRHKDEVAEAGGSLTLTVFMMKALVTALKAHPRFNASFDARSGEIVLKHYYHIGVAVDTERGLIVPVIRDVDRKSLTELAIELKDLAERTRAGEAKLPELQGGAFTITNVGALGGTSFSPIINFPEVAIMGMARARWKPVVQTHPAPDGGEPEREIVPRFMLPLVLTFDHRVLDGGDAGRFMQVLTEMLQEPEKLLLKMG